MKCEDLQFNLPLYADDGLSAAERLTAEAHLETCPICRVKLSSYQAMRGELRNFSIRPAPADLQFAMRRAVAAELKNQRKVSAPLFSSQFRYWLQYRLMPYSVGTVASLILTFSLLLTLLSTKEATEQSVQYAKINANRTTVLLAPGGVPNSGETADSYNADSSNLNPPISSQQPSFNPSGALIALSNSIVSGKIKDEEVTVVADVFGNGIARIAEVVSPPHNQQAMRDLERALYRDPSYAPFVPAAQDNRSDVVRVVLKIQRVDVIEKTPRPKTRSRAF